MAMKILSDILYKVRLIQLAGNADLKISMLAFDSRKVEPGALFVATKGTASDGHAFIQAAIGNGAVAVVCEQMPKDLLDHITYVKVDNSQEALGVLAANYYEHPSQKLQLIGITGTNGKTTIATLLHKLFQKSGRKSGLISTVCNIIGDEVSPATHTTPDALELNRLFTEMLQQGCSYCFMEVSSHAIHQRRIAGVNFRGGVFTNITHDHLDYHKTFQEYLKAKKTFFDELPAQAFALTNIDDKNGWVMLQNTAARKYSYGLRNMADYSARLVENLITGLVLQVEGKDVWCRLVGDFNAYNLMAIYGVARLLGMEPDLALTGISELESVEGRFDYFIGRDQITGIVDYAHTPDALENVLSTIQSLRRGYEQVITVVGCGGNRDAAKRPLMAAIAARYSSKVVLTSDNPRYEDPEEIIRQMQAGLDPQASKKALVVSNRGEAIKVAAALASKGDIVLVAGKGHEKYQEIQGIRHPFDDKLVLREMLAVQA